MRTAIFRQIKPKPSLSYWELIKTVKKRVSSNNVRNVLLFNIDIYTVVRKPILTARDA